MTAKFTGVGRLLGREHGNMPVSLPIPQEKFDDATFIARLSFRQTSRVPTDMQDQLEHLPMHSDHALFIDTNLTWLDEEWWETLLAEPGRVHVPGRVVRGLVPFLRHNQSHPLRIALTEKNPAIVLRPDIEDDVWSKSFD